MGIGPYKNSLLARISSFVPVIDEQSTVTDMEREQKARNNARLVARIRYAQKHKKSSKPVAPVIDTGFAVKHGLRYRAWKWVGETIPSKSFFTGYCYTAGELRVAGYKLPTNIVDMEREQQTRSKACLVGRIRYAQKHKKPGRPLAPVKYAYSIGKGHWWQWIGEKPVTFELNGATITLCDMHSSFMLKAAGFKLPKLPPKKDRIDG